ncbi:MAG: MerR family transcriptional regulator, partial [Frankiales bacterium]|nr:MerR family transcriptional regulator [Frankiales bacterium]
TWDRRYGLGPSEHAAGAHRRYSPMDVTRLQTMRRLTLEGVQPGEAARVVLAEPLVPGTEPNAPMPDREGRLSPRRGGPGGRVLALPSADATVRGVGRAAMALDAAAVTRILREQIAAHGVLHTWDHVLRPVLVAVGARWAATGEGVEVEHMLSDCAAVALRATSEQVAERPGRRPVLLACAPDEQHALTLHALGAGLAERGVATRTLGPAMPAAALEAAVRRTGPAALFIWSQLRGSADIRVLETLPVTRPPTAVVVGGPGWLVDRLPERVGVAEDLQHAVELVEQALGA